MAALRVAATLPAVRALVARAAARALATRAVDVSLGGGVDGGSSGSGGWRHGDDRRRGGGAGGWRPRDDNRRRDGGWEAPPLEAGSRMYTGPLPSRPHPPRSPWRRDDRERDRDSRAPRWAGSDDRRRGGGDDRGSRFTDDRRSRDTDDRRSHYTSDHRSGDTDDRRSHYTADRDRRVAPAGGAPLALARSDGSEMLHGIHPACCAVAAGHRSISAAWVSAADARSTTLAALVEELTARGVRVTRTDKATLGALAGSGAVHQGIVVAASPLALPVADGDGDFLPYLDAAAAAAGGAAGVVLVLDGVVDPHNVGAILRSALLFGVTAVVLPLHDSAPLNATVSKTSSGALELLAAQRRLWHTRNIGALLPHLRERAWRVLAAAAAAPPQSPDPTPPPPAAGAPAERRAVAHLCATAVTRDTPTVLILGSEARGVRRALLEAADATVSVPQAASLPPPPAAAGAAGAAAAAAGACRLPLVDSLNVSVAAGVLLFQLRGTAARSL